MALLDVNDPGAARIALRAAVALGDTSPPTLLNLAIAEDRAGDIAARPRPDADRRGSYCRDWDEPLLRLAESLRAAGESAAAEAAYRRVLEVNPRREEALIALAGLLIVAGRGRRSAHSAAALPRHRARPRGGLGGAGPRLAADRRTGAGAHRVRWRRSAWSRRCLNTRCTASRPRASPAWPRPNSPGSTLASEADPLNPVPLLARGVLLERLGRRMEAMDALDAAAALAPDALLPVKLLGGVLARSHRLREAEAALRRASELDPDDPRLRNDRATVLMRLHRHAEARALLLGRRSRSTAKTRWCCATSPMRPPAWAGRRRRWHWPAARSSWTRTPCCRAARCATRCRIATASPAPNCWRRCATAPPGCRATDLGRFRQRPRPRAPADRRAAVRHAEDASGGLADRRRDRDARSGAVRRRLPGAERRAARIRSRGGSARRRATGSTSTRWTTWRWRRGRADLGDRRADRPRRLWRCGAHAGLRASAGAGAGEMGRHAEPQHAACRRWTGSSPTAGRRRRSWSQLYSERLLRLPDGYVCYSPPAYAPDVVPLPALANGHITFGCFNNLAKVTPRVIATWAAVLHRVPGSRLVLKTHQFGDRADRGSHCATPSPRRASTPARLELRGSSPHRAFMGEYGADRHRAGPVSLFRRADHLRGVVDGRADRDAAGRDLRLPPFHEPSEQCRADRLGGARRGGLCATGGGEGGGRGGAGGAARGAAGARQGEPAVRRAALRPQPRRRVAACLDASGARHERGSLPREYWETAVSRRRQRRGRDRSGHMAAFKADVHQRLRRRQRDRRRAGPGLRRWHLLSLLQVPAYVGVDVSHAPRWPAASRGFRSTASCRSPRWMRRCAQIWCCRST